MNTTTNSAASLTSTYDKARSQLSGVSAQTPRQQPGETEAAYQERLRLYSVAIADAAKAIPRR